MNGTLPAAGLLKRGLRGISRPFSSAGVRLYRTAHGYRAADLRGDAVSGLTVAMVAIPQSMAYAIIAGVRPEYGIFTVIFQCFIGAIFNSHPLLSVGPINTQSLLVASIVTRLAGGDAATFLSLTIALTMLKGIVQMAMATAQLGNLARYISHSVVVGFTAGAGVLIAAGQIKNLLGVETVRSHDNWPGIVGQMQRLLPNLDQTSWHSVSLGVTALLIVIVARMISKFVPGPLLAVLVTGAIVAALGWGDPADAEAALLPIVGEIPSALPWPPSIPDLSIHNVEILFAGALALSLLGLMEAYSIGKSLAAKTGDRISANQELFSQGLTNFASSFFQCIPGSGSFSRSALNHYAGGRTIFSGFFNSAFVLIIFLLMASHAGYIPYAAIAAVLFVIAYGLIDWAYLRRALKSSKADAIVCAGTFLATLFAPLAYAVFIGVFLNIALYLRKASQLHVQEMVRTAAGPFEERPISDRHSGEKHVMFLSVEGDLFFAMADELEDRLMTVANSNVRAVILRLKRTHSLDSTVMTALETFVQRMHSKGGHVLLCGIRSELMEKLHAFGLVRLIGEDNVFEASFGVFTSAKRALQRARELVGSSFDIDQLGDDDETEGWSYEI